MISLTDRAVAELKDLMQSQGREAASLRIWVAGGGCSGLSYGMGLDDDAPEQGDMTFEQDGVRIIVDPISLGYMEGSKVDFVDDDFGGGFKIDNPNAVSSCGCGNSFKTEDSPAGAGGCGGCAHRA
jgi:iron-sulfur cluster assembly accessory protein